MSPDSIERLIDVVLVLCAVFALVALLFRAMTPDDLWEE